MTAQVVWSTDMHFPPETRSPAHARTFVTHLLTQHGLTYLIDDVRLVVSELVTNAVVHAQTPIRVSVAELLFCLRVTVFDERADVPTAPLAERVDADAEGGRGLWVTEACSSDWGTDLREGQGKSVWALFPVRAKSSWVGPTTTAATIPVQSPRSTHDGGTRVAARFQVPG